MFYYGVTGHPLGHTWSPPIHRRLFALSGRQAAYDPFPLPPEDFLRELPRLFALDGFNLTMPYKQTVLPYLDQVDEGAAFYGSVNTVKNEGGRHIGYNTDWVGFLKTMESHGFSLASTVCVLGAGGVGRMFALESARRGAQVTVAARPQSLDKARAVAAEIKEKTGRGAEAADITGLRGPFGLIINATPVGMSPDVSASPVGPGVLENAGAVFDCIYNPSQTLLLRYAARAGVPAAGGMDMLVWQAAVAHQHWYGAKFDPGDIAALIREMEEALREKEAPHE